MAVQPFYAGSFSRSSEMVEWDGANTSDLLTYINSKVTYGNQWTVDEVNSTASVLVVTREVEDESPQVVAIPLDSWLDVPGWNIFVAPKEGRWKTSDPYGRPEDIDDVVAP